MKVWGFKLLAIGTEEVEDPDGPWGWRGSGIYTISKDATIEGYVVAAADTEEEARDIAEDYFETHIYMYDIEEIKVEESELWGDCEEGDPKGVIESECTIGDLMIRYEDDY